MKRLTCVWLMKVQTAIVSLEVTDQCTCQNCIFSCQEQGAQFHSMYSWVIIVHITLSGKQLCYLCSVSFRAAGVRLIQEMSQEDLHAVVKSCFALVNSSVSEGMSAAILEVTIIPNTQDVVPECSCSSPLKKKRDLFKKV